MGLSNELSCEAGSFSRCLNPHRFFSVRGFEALFPCTGTLNFMICLTPQLFLPVISTQMWDCQVLQLPPCCESSLPGCSSPPLLRVWMNVSSLTPWLVNFHTVQFTGTSCCLLFLNLLLPFFRLCEEEMCFYLYLPLGWKFTFS